MQEIVGSSSKQGKEAAKAKNSIPITLLLLKFKLTRWKM